MNKSEHSFSNFGWPQLQNQAAQSQQTNSDESAVSIEGTTQSH